MQFDPLSQDEFLALSPEKQMAYQHAWEDLQPRGDTAPPLNPPPATLGALLTECERQRGRIVDAMRQGQARFYPGTDANFLALLKGKISGFVLPPLGRLFDAAVALDLGDVPPLRREPRTGREAVALLDSLIRWCRAKQEPSPVADAEPAVKQSPANGKRPGGRKRLEDNDHLKLNLYNLICRNYQRGERYRDAADRFKQNKDIAALAKRVGLPLNTTTVRNAVEWERQANRRNRQRPPNNTDDCSATNNKLDCD